MPGRTPLTPPQAAAPKAPFKWDQYGYTAGGPVLKNHLFFMSNLEGYKDRKQFQTLYSRAVDSDAERRLFGTAGQPRRDQSANRPADRDRCRPDAVHRRRHDADLRAVSRQHHSSEPAERAPRSKLLEFYPEPNTGARAGLTNNYLSLQDRVIDKYQYTQRMDFVQSSTIGVDGPLQLRQRRTKSRRR